MAYLDNFFEEMRKAQEKEREEMRKNVKGEDDGTVKGLLLAGDYRNIGHEVIRRKVVGTDVEWVWADINTDEFSLLKKNNDSSWEWIDSIASDIEAVCYGEIEKEEIVLCALLDSHIKRMTGCVFTESKLYILEKGELQSVINYVKIRAAEYDDKFVTLILSNGVREKIWCHGVDSYTSYREYTENMYGLIMDIKKRLEEIGIGEDEVEDDEGVVDITSSHDKKIRCFRQHMESFRNTYKGYAGKEIEVDWIKRARENYAFNADYDEVVGLYDTSFSGKGKTGLLFTDDYLYWKRSVSKGIIRLSDIQDITFYDEYAKKDVDRGVIFWLKNGEKVMWEGFCSLKCEAFIKFMKEYIEIK